jgi:hypothetical protein
MIIIHDDGFLFISSLFSQYLWTLLAVGTATGYGIVRRPGTSRGVGILLVGAAAGSITDYMYGYYVTCHSQVQNVQQLLLDHQQQQQQQQQQQLAQPAQQQTPPPTMLPRRP